MSANPCPQNIWNHTDGCTCTPNGSVTSEADVDLTSTQADAAPAPISVVGSCPDCGQPMLGHLGNNRFVPGASCSSCPHTAMTFERETEPNEEDRVYLYEVQEDLLIRVTDEDGDTVDLIRPDEDSHVVHWDREITGLGFDPAAFRRAHLAANDPHAYVEAVTEDGGYAHLGQFYSVVLDREQVPEHAVVARATDPDALVEDDEAVEKAIDAVYYAADRSIDEDAYAIDDARWAEIEADCEEAGLGVMRSFYESMANREILHKDHVADAETVTNDYWNHVGPAVDRIEDRLLNDLDEESKA